MTCQSIFPRVLSALVTREIVSPLQFSFSSSSSLSCGFGPITCRSRHSTAAVSEPLRKELDATPEDIRELVETIKANLSSINDGAVSISAYDTAWVALIEDIHASGTPQFPSTLQWIAENQLPDGSWGDQGIFLAHDRLLNTLACVIALKTWDVFPEQLEKGLSFIQENMCKLGDEDTIHSPAGFETVFPSLMEKAQVLNLDVHKGQDPSAFQEIYAKRDLKLRRIPKEMMHRVPTTLLHSLEGMSTELEWGKLLKLQCKDGSFLGSLASTAFAYMQTKNNKCLQYLQKVVQHFGGGVPTMYPLDLMDRIFSVDRLERLGISRHFQPEIEECLNHVYRFWNENGVGWARNLTVHDIDDTAIAFRLLRMHGHDVSPDVFRHFEKDGEFFCFPGQTSEGVTVMCNLYKASQVSFPGETILQEAKQFSSKFLREKQASNQLLDKWLITKNLSAEVGYTLDVPWYASLPRIEARFYIDQYGGENDVWIAKTLYRLPNVSNKTNLELAKLDFNKCQEQHQLEWLDVQKWYTECNLEMFMVDKKELLQAYFLAAACIFEPERSKMRLAWTKSAVLIKAVSLHFEGISSEHQRLAFIQEFVTNMKANGSYNSIKRRKTKNATSEILGGLLIQALVLTLNRISSDVLLDHGRDIHHQLQGPWEFYLSLNNKEERQHHEAYLLVQKMMFCSIHLPQVAEEDYNMLFHPKYNRLVSLNNSITHQLLRQRTQSYHSKNVKDHEKGNNGILIDEDADLHIIESDMQELVKCALRRSDNVIDHEIKQTFLMVVKSYFYVTHCLPETIDFHIAKVLFEKLV
ncbi:hypothetical protein MKW92_042998 [Papaver armeniacum]|nr:hypothetical protein MKW92_042998 [Papaver armeniacum]